MRRAPYIFSILIVFIFNSIISPVQAQELSLPKPGTMVRLSSAFMPAMLKGIKVYPDNPFKFEFVMDKGDGYFPSLDKEGIKGSLQQESTKLIKYFLAALTVPEKDLWVNLSPYEKDRIVPDAFGKTEMGRDLLALDYMLKQITASLIYPEDEIGKKFWKRVYEEAAKKFGGSTSLTINTFNKVWIVPEKAVVYENAKAGTAYVVESKLKVMLEQDYLAESKLSARGGSASGGKVMLEEDYVVLNKNSVGVGSKPTQKRAGYEPAPTKDVNQIGSQIIREIVIPALTKEINTGKNFAQLRQVYHSLILATWYKKKIKESILAQVYADRNKIKGTEYSKSVVDALSTRGHVQDRTTRNSVALSPSRLPINEAMNMKATQRNDPNDVELIYQRYLQAFKKGAYNYIKEEQDPVTQQMIPRKYFSGGFNLAMTGVDPKGFERMTFATTENPTMIHDNGDNAALVAVNVRAEGITNSAQISSANAAMNSTWSQAVEAYAQNPIIQEGLQIPLNLDFFVKQNIETSRDAVAHGRHGTVFYPASGLDAVRTMLAYDANTVLAVDGWDLGERVLDTLKKLNLANLKETGESGEKIITFDLDGRQRRIIQVKGDANGFQVDRFLGSNKIDIYQELYGITKDTERMNTSIYFSVNTNGFFVLDGHSFFPKGMGIQEKFLDVFGLKEYSIMQRHPSQIGTGEYFGLTELPNPEKGYVYQKAQEISEDKVIALNRLINILKVLNETNDPKEFIRRLHELSSLLSRLYIGETNEANQTQLKRMWQDIQLGFVMRTHQLGLDLRKIMPANPFGESEDSGDLYYSTQEIHDSLEDSSFHDQGSLGKIPVSLVPEFKSEIPFKTLLDLFTVVKRSGHIEIDIHALREQLRAGKDASAAMIHYDSSVQVSSDRANKSANVDHAEIADQESHKALERINDEYGSFDNLIADFIKNNDSWKFLNAGREAFVYQIPKLPQYVLRVGKSGINFKTVPHDKIDFFDSPLPASARNHVGYTLLKKGPFYVLQFAAGEPSQFRSLLERDYGDHLRRVAQMPQEAFDTLIETLVELVRNNWGIDLKNPDNLLVDYEKREFNVVDVRYRGGNFKSTELSLMRVLNSLLDLRHFGGNNPDSHDQEYMPLRKAILIKATKAALKFNLNPEGFFMDAPFVQDSAFIIISPNPREQRKAMLSRLFGISSFDELRADLAMKSDGRFRIQGTASFKEAIQNIQEKLEAPMERGGNWLRITATPQEAMAFHKQWQSNKTGHIDTIFNGENYHIPVGVYEKMETWFAQNEKFERRGYFIAHKENNQLEILDFIPLSSWSMDPMQSGTGETDEKTSQASIPTDMVISSPELADAFNIDMNAERELSFEEISKNKKDFVEIQVHSHHLDSAYSDGPSEGDMKVPSNPVRVVYTLKHKQGYIFNNDHPEVRIDKALISLKPNNLGGIDLGASDKAMQIKNDGQGGIKFRIDPAQLAQLQNASGFRPEIINIQPMTDLKVFLGIIN